MLLPFSLVFDGVWVWGLATSDLVLCFLFLQDCPCQFFLVRIPSSGSLKCIPSCSSQYRHGLGLPPRVLLTLPGQPLEDTALSGTAPGYPGRAGVLAQVLCHRVVDDALHALRCIQADTCLRCCSHPVLGRVNHPLRGGVPVLLRGVEDRHIYNYIRCLSCWGGVIDISPSDLASLRREPGAPAMGSSQGLFVELPYPNRGRTAGRPGIREHNRRVFLHHGTDWTPDDFASVLDDAAGRIVAHPRRTQLSQQWTEVTREARENSTTNGFDATRFGRRVVTGIFEDFARRYAQPGAPAPKFRPGWKLRSVCVYEAPARLARQPPRRRAPGPGPPGTALCACTGRCPKARRHEAPSGSSGASAHAAAAARPGTKSGSWSTFRPASHAPMRSACAAGTRAGAAPSRATPATSSRSGHARRPNTVASHDASRGASEGAADGAKRRRCCACTSNARPARATSTGTSRSTTRR